MGFTSGSFSVRGDGYRGREWMLLRIVSQEAVMLREREEKKRKKATNYVEKQTLGMHTQHPGTFGNKEATSHNTRFKRIHRTI